MPFVEYKVSGLRGHGAEGTGLSVSLRKQKPTVRALLSVFLSPAVAFDLGWSEGDKFEVLLGTEEQHGLIRLRSGPNGSTTASTRHAGKVSFLGIALRHVPAYVDRSEPKQFCAFKRVDDGWIEIVLPKWADETNPSRPRSAGPTPQRPLIVEHRHTDGPARPPLGRRMTDVASRLQGDPPRERSALANRGEADLEREALRKTEEEGRRQSEAIARDEMRAFGTSEKKLIAALIDGLHHSYADLAGSVGSVSKNSIPAMISPLRRKLRIHGISIETIPGGFAMSPDMAERARSLL